MKCNVFGWLLGLPFVALIWGLAVQGERTKIVQDLELRTQFALAQNNLEWAKARFDATEGLLTGAAYTADERQRAVDTVRKTWGVWHIADKTALLEEAPNYVWGAALRDDNIQLTGFVPNEQARRHILNVAKNQFPGREVRDDMQPARGAPGQDLWINGIDFGLRQLVQLKQGGRVDLHGTLLQVSGEAESVVAYRSIKGDFIRRMPNGILLAKDDVLPPTVQPFAWRATQQANQLELSGHVPSGKVRDRVIEIAKSAFPKAAIVDKMIEAGGAPENWLQAVNNVLNAMAQLEVAEVSISDRDVTVTGLAIQEVTSERVTANLRIGMPEKFTLTPKIAFREPTLQKIDPFTTTLSTDGEKVSLTGYAPDERGRQRLVATAKSYFPQREIVDALSYGSGAPLGWLTCAEAGLLGLSRLDKGRADLSGPLLQLSGETRDEKIATALPAEVRAAANRSCKDTIQILVKAPPEPTLQWQAIMLDNRLELSGEVINSDVKDEILADAKKLFPKYELVDNMRIKPGSSSKWAKVVRLGLAELAKLRSGLVRLDGLVLTLDGVAPDTAVLGDVTSRVKRGVASGYSGQVTIEVKSDAMIWSEQEAKRKSEATAGNAKLDARKAAEAAQRAAALQEVQRRAADAAAKALADAQRKQQQINEERLREAEQERLKAAAEEKRRKEEEARSREAEAEAKRKAEITRISRRCKRELNETVANGTITFEVASDRLTESSTQTLDRLIDTYRNCPGARLEISGHTDATGSPGSNIELSQRRAQAVLDYFIAKGLPNDRFVARGYGETRPRAANDTSSGRARNRRIEFDVLIN